MITMNELVDLRMQQQIAQEILYRQQIMQRLPDPFAAAMMPSMQMLTPHLMMPTHPPLPGVESKLENEELWQQFHKIGTEMIITKSGRRMFPSMRVSLKGLEEESQYCVLVEMVPIGDCRYKFSGSQWVPAGGAEPQSPQRMYLHPDSPASGNHWQAQPILFNKVKLTNNTLDNNGHVVLASMHKYQPRIHVIRTNDLSQIPWAPQQAFVFPETEFVAVTAYQNDRITKLKIDNNPFAKGFRETGQSKCKRKMSLSPALSEDQSHINSSNNNNNNSSQHTDDDQSSVASSQDSPQAKRFCTRDDRLPYMDFNEATAMRFAIQQHDFAPTFYHGPQFTQMPLPLYLPHVGGAGGPGGYIETQRFELNFPQNLNTSECDYNSGNEEISGEINSQTPELFVDVVSTLAEETQNFNNMPERETLRTSPKLLSPQSLTSSLSSSSSSSSSPPMVTTSMLRKSKSDSLISSDIPSKRSSFSISSILSGNSRNIVSV